MKRERKSARYYIVSVLFFVFMAIFIVSGYMVYKTSEGYREEKKISGAMQEFNPVQDRKQASDAEDADTKQNLNPSLIKALSINEDIAAWITMDGTYIDYIVVKGESNDEYIKADIYGKYALAGTIFEDYRCPEDFSGVNNIIYGHNMKNGSMFGTLSRFSGDDFFQKHPTGTLYLPDKTCELEIFAFLTVKSTDEVIYNPSLNGSDIPEYMEYIKSKSSQYRDIGISENDKIITLSTCAFSFEGARSVVLARIN